MAAHRRVGRRAGDAIRWLPPVQPGVSQPLYGDPEAGFGDYIWLGQTSEQCGLRSRAEVVGDPRPLAVRTFEGSVVESSSGTIGFLSDGTTAVQFETDLPVDDVAALLASLRPFEPDAEPEPLAAASMG
jgi:hypothetical protein